MIYFIVGAIAGFAGGYYFNSTTKNEKFADKNKDGIPDSFQKGGRPKGSKNKKK